MAESLGEQVQDLSTFGGLPISEAMRTRVTASSARSSGEVSRAQMGTFLARLLAKMVADGHVTYPPTNPVPISDPEPDPGCVDLNSASLEAQQEIVHIGVTRAQDIVDGRPWSTVEQLDEIDGIGPARLQDILDQNLACVT